MVISFTRDIGKHWLIFRPSHFWESVTNITSLNWACLVSSLECIRLHLRGLGMSRSIAKRKQRIIGGFIDLMIVTGFVLLIALTINSFVNGFDLSLSENLQLVKDTKASYVLTIPMLMLVNWNLLREGQTIGMRLVGIKVVMKNGHDTTKVTASLRLCLSYLIEMLIPFTSLLNIVLLFCHPERRLLHDMLSGTKVVNC